MGIIRGSKGVLIFTIFFISSIFLANLDLNAQSSSGESGTENVQQGQNTQEIPTDETAVAKGRQLFGQHCTICHQIDKQVIGPALASVHQRRPIPWLLAFIKNSQNVISNQEDEYAQQLFQQYNRMVMPPFEFLSDDDIMSVLAYIQAESSSPTSEGGVNGASSAQTESFNEQENQDVQDNMSTEDAAPADDDQSQNPEEVSTGISTGLVLGILAGMFILIGIIFAVARSSTKSARKVK